MQSTLIKIDPAKLDYKELPVDPKNIKEIERQVLAWGGIHTPVEIWKEGNRLIDGFHRTGVAVALGMPEIDALLIDCTESEFWDKRISQAKKHVAVEDSRLHAWILSAWQVSPFVTTERDQNFTNAIYAIHQGLSGSEKFKLSKDYRPILEWFKKKAGMWGRPALEVSSIILEHEKVFAAQFPEAKTIAREEDLTAEQAKVLTRTFPKGARGAGFGKGLSKTEMRKYASEVVKENIDITPEQWQKQQEEKQKAQKQREIVFQSTPAGVEEKRRRRIDNGVAAIQALRIVEHRITDLLGFDLSEILLSRPDLRDSVKRFFDKVGELGVKFDQSKVFSVPDEAERLALLAKIMELERELEIARRNQPVMVHSDVIALAGSQIN